MTDQYARAPMTPASLDNGRSSLSAAVVAIDRGVTRHYANAMATRDRIAEKLTKAFTPQSLEVMDESHRHEGHAGHRPGGETHFRVYIVSEAFRGKTRLARHRMVNETLVRELEAGVHALAIHASAPGEG
jgi:BolA family transcriptional regulator, general stress-responsive regulator